MVAAVQRENQFIKTLPTLVEGEGLERFTRLMAATSKTCGVFIPSAPLKGLIKVTSSAKEFLCGLHLFERIHEWSCTNLLKQNRSKIASRALLTVAHAIDTVTYFGKVWQLYDLAKLSNGIGKAFPFLTPVFAYSPITLLKNSCVLGSAIFSISSSSIEMNKVNDKLSKMHLTASRVDALKGAIAQGANVRSKAQMQSLKENARVLGYHEADIQNEAQLVKIADYSIKQFESEKQKIKKTWIGIAADIAKIAVVSFASVLVLTSLGSIATVAAALTVVSLNNEIFGMMKFLSREALFTKLPQAQKPESIA